MYNFDKVLYCLDMMIETILKQRSIEYNDDITNFLWD